MYLCLYMWERIRLHHCYTDPSYKMALTHSDGLNQLALVLTGDKDSILVMQLSLQNTHRPICLCCIKDLAYTHFRAIQVAHLHDEMGWRSNNDASGLTLQHAVFHAEAALSNTCEDDMIFAGMTFSSLSPVDAHRVYPHRIPSIASCWINLMLESLTSAPVDSINESPLSFFSITTSSGSPNPVGHNKRKGGRYKTPLDLFHCSIFCKIAH